MASELPVVDLTFKAATDYSAAQFHAMYISAADTVTICSAVTDVFVGILQNKPAAAGRAAVVRVAGISKALAAGTISAGARVTVDSSGHFVAAAPGSGVNNCIVGIAVTGAASGDVFDVLVLPQIMQGQ